jgi:hypothetical protein
MSLSISSWENVNNILLQQLFDLCSHMCAVHQGHMWDKTKKLLLSNTKIQIVVVL